MRWFWRAVWNTSELTGVGLGRFAPFVFGRMLGAKGKRVA
jgi:hypothetical protein